MSKLLASIFRDHHLLDEKHRRVGGWATIRRELVANPETGRSEEMLRLMVYATRNGAIYGALPPPLIFPLAEYHEACIWAERKLVAQRKRYMKKYGRDRRNRNREEQ